MWRSSGGIPPEDEEELLLELEAGEESDKGYHEFLQGMADREIICLYENYGIVTNIKIEGWEPPPAEGRGNQPESPRLQPTHKSKWKYTSKRTSSR